MNVFQLGSFQKNAQIAQKEPCSVYFHYLYFYHWQKYEGYMQPESKKFSLDPQITSFEMLQHIIASAFSIKGFVLLPL